MTAFNGQGKDQVIFVTKEEHEIPSSVKEEDANEDPDENGLILPTGEINWDCPCLGGMASGVCGEQFKSAFTCFYLSHEEVKASDCLGQFIAMQECFHQHPEDFPQEDDPQTADPEQKHPSSISDFSTSKQSDTSLTKTDEVPSELPIAS